MFEIDKKIIEDVLFKHGIKLIDISRVREKSEPSAVTWYCVKTDKDIPQCLQNEISFIFREAVFSFETASVSHQSNVSHPSHYNQGKIEVIEFIEDKALGFHRGNAVKYIARAGKKNPDKEAEDLEKAIWYLKRDIENLNARKENRLPIKPNDMN